MDAKLRMALDEITLRSLRTISWISGMLFALVAATKPAILASTIPGASPRFIALMTAYEVATCLAFLVVYGLIASRKIAPRRANAILAGAVAVVAIGTLLQMAIARDPLRTFPFLVLMLGAGALITSAPWFAAAMMSCAALWSIGAAFAMAPAAALPYAVVLAEAGVLAVAIFLARMRMLRDMVSLRQRDAARAVVIENALAAREAAQRDLTQALRERQVLIDTVPDLVYGLNAASELTFWNRRVEEVTGLKGAQLRGRPCSELIVEAERPLVPKMIQACVLTGRVVQDFHLLAAGDRAIAYQFLKAPLRNAEGEVVGFAGVGRDVNDERRAQRRLAAQHAVTRVIAADGPETATLARVLAELGEALDRTVGSIWILNARGRLQNAGTWRHGGGHGAFEPASAALTFAPNEGFPGRVLASGEAEWIVDVWEDPGFVRKEAARAEGIHSALAFPIKEGARTVGVVDLYGAATERPDAELVAMMNALGGQLGAYLQRKREQETIRRLNVELEKRNADLAVMNADLESFSYTVSHDLRAPLRGIKHFHEVAQEAQREGETASVAAHIAHADRLADRMSQIMEDILSFSRAGRHPLRVQPVDVLSIAREIVDELRSREPQRAIEISVGRPISVDADPQLVRIALENLIGNAWKFTRGTPNARIEIGARDTSPPTFYVRDNGAGFEAEGAHRLFSPFQRYHTQQEFEGTGIGLAIVQRIVARHGGTIAADSRPGRGATFSFTLAPAPARTPATIIR